MARPRACLGRAVASGAVLAQLAPTAPDGSPAPYDLLWLAISIIGTTLHVFMALLLWRRRSKVASEQAFLLGILAALMWHLGNLLSLLAQFVDPVRLEPVFGYCVALALLGLATLPPLMLHTLLLYLDEREAGLPRVAYWILLTLGYGGAVYGLYRMSVLWTLGSFTPARPIPVAISPELVLWFAAVLAACAALTYRLLRYTEDGLPRAFEHGIVRTFLAISALVLLTYLVDLRGGPAWLHDSLVISTSLTAVFPCLIYAYSIYKLNYMELVLVQAMLWAVLGLVVVLIYLVGIRPLGVALGERLAAEGAPRLNLRLVEALLVIALVAASQPMKNQLQELLSRLVFQEQGAYRDLFRKLYRRVVARSFVDPSSLLDYVARTLSQEMHLTSVYILFFERRRDALELSYSNLAQPEFDVAPLVRALAIRGGAVTLHDFPDREFARVMRAQRLETAVPIYQDGELVGAFLLGKRGLRRGLFQEEEQMLVLLGSQVAFAMGNTTVVRQKLEMGRKLYENEKLSSLGRLSASIAHEVKNPLSSIKSITQVMLEDLPPDHAHRADLEIINAEVDRLNKVVNQLLQFARARPEGPAVFELAEVLGNVLLMLGPPARKKGIEIEHAVPPGLELVASRDAFTEMFFNVVDNAIQVLDDRPAVDGPSRVVVKVLVVRNDQVVARPAPAYRVGASDTWLAIEVADNGPGIPPELRDRIFEPFFTTREDGTGLGLSIVREKAAQLGGRIELARSAPGDTAFRIILPVQPLERAGMLDPRALDAPTVALGPRADARTYPSGANAEAERPAR